MEEYNFDLVIVGAGPAGSSAAFAASKEGISVALLEKEKHRPSLLLPITFASQSGLYL